MKLIFRTKFFRAWDSQFGVVDIWYGETPKRHLLGVYVLSIGTIGLQGNFLCSGHRIFRRFWLWFSSLYKLPECFTTTESVTPRHLWVCQ